MKRRFTILTAALALLVSLAIPMGVWGQSTYTKVTETPTDWSGTYVIVADASNVIFTGQSGTNNYGGYASVQISDNSVTGNFAAYEVEIEQSGTYYSIKHINSSKYLGWTSGNNLYFSTTVPTANSYRWVLSTSSILNASDNTRKLQYNSGSPRFACYSSSQKVAYLYKKETGGGTTPTMSVSPNSIDFGSNAINPANPYTQTFEVTFANLTENLTVTGFSGVSVSPASINYNATSPQTVTVTYNPTTAGSISGNISVNSSEVNEALVAVTGSAYDPANVDSYELYTGEIVEGDYVIYNTHGAMKNELNGGPRFNNESVTISDDIITNPTNNVIWHIAPIENTEYWTIYNAAINKYAGGTTSKNQGALYDDYTNDHAKWKIYYSYSTLYIENLGRSQDANDSGNKYLRQNTTATAGWATYANSGSYVPKLYKKVITNQVVTPTFSVVSGTYYEPKTVELSCETSGATIYYTTDGTTPSASNGTVYTTAINVSTTTTIKAIAIATGMTDSDVATATYTIEQPYSTIPALFAAATNTEQDVRVTFNNWVVSGVSTNGKSVYVTDNIGNGFIIYFTSDMSGTFAAGNILSGTAVACKLKLYNGAAELVNLTATDLTITTGGTVSISNIPMSDLSGVNTGALVSYNNLTCSVSDNKYYLTDGTTTLQAYNTLYAFNEFVAGKTYNVKGVYVQYNSIKEIAPRSAADIEEVQVQHNEYTLTVGNLVHVTTYVFDASDQSETLLVGAGQVDIYDGTEVMISLDVEEGYVIESLIVGGVDVTSQIDADAYTFTMPTNAVTVTATAVEDVPPTPGNYVRINSLNQLTDGSKVIIAARHNATADSYYAMQNATSGKPEGTLFTSVTSGNDEAVASTITDDEDNYYWTVNVTENGYTFTNAINQMIGYSSSTNFATGNNTEWTIESAEAGNNAMVPGYEGFVITNGTTTTRAFAFNGTAFGAYSTNNMNAAGYNFFLDFFVQTSAPVTEPITIPIDAWTTVNGVPGNWYLITSPLADPIDPTDVGNMIPENLSNVDLYRFNQAAGLEWINYKDENYQVNPSFGNLEAGTGYLYANSQSVDLAFTGTPYSGTGVFPLTYSEANSDPNMRGWNLVGNPFTVEATVDHTYYRMNENRTEIMLGTGKAGAMEGIFVRATAAGQNVTFNSSSKATSNMEQTVIDLSMNNVVIDRAIISFGEGEPFPKIQLNQNNTKIYFMMENGAYAVVIGGYQAELPLNFKAATAGTYTLSFDNQNAEFDNLILIDNQTNTQVNLLNNPSYSFSAQTTDDEARFTVVYQRASSYLTIGTGDLYSASGNNSSDSTKDGMGSPVGNTYYTASTAQFIYMASEMEGAKTIRSLAFYHNNQGPFVGTVKIYLAHTSASQVYTSNPATSGTLVYEGTNINIGSSSAGWQTFTLDTPFPYNGTDNLLVVVCRTKATSGSPNYHTDQGWKYTSYSQHYYYMQRSGNGNDTYGNITTTGNYARGFKRPNIKIGYTAPTVNHFYLDIDGWTSSRNNYYLIASPIGQVAPTAVDNMLSNTYDLFYFDQDGDDEGYEWMTYKPGNGATDPGFDLVPGKGYLYANSGVAGNNPNVVTLTFTGWGYTGSGQVDLIYSEANSDSNMHGWNLVGNPFGVEAYIDRPFYRMNEEGSELNGESETGSIGIMEGVFVYTTQNETMTFTTTPSGSKGSMVALNLSKDRKVIDRAIVSFGEGKQLPKFQLNRNNTKLYIPQDNKDYAIVCAEEQGEMPVSFKAEDNGIYNLNFSTENVEFAYLHLIDNMTGTDVDLLQTPSYSFEAKTTDYASRFKLVFATGDNSTSDTFAFFSNGSFVINNEGNATLQVIDVTGRILKSESINGCANVDVNAAPGVYMLRLVNGDNVKVQKVVVK